MHADGRTVPNGELVRTHACIVGAGPAGIAIARELARGGSDVVLLERGAWEGAGLLEPLLTTDSVGLQYDIDGHRGTGFGGSTHKWLVETPLGHGFGRLREYDHDDFEHRPWVPYSGWPLTKRNLVPYYTRARSLFDVDWPSDNPEPEWDEEWVRAHPRTHLANVNPRVFPFADPSVFSGPMRRELENSERALILTHAVATEFRGNDTGTRVEAVQVAASPASSFSVEADVFVLATGAIENARLLLNSRVPWSTGLGNGHDLVGRFFMEHPRFTAGILTASDPALIDDRTFHAITLHGGIPVQPKYRLDVETTAREGLTNNTFFFTPAVRSVRLAAAREGLHRKRGPRAVRSLLAAAGRRRVPPSSLRLAVDLATDLTNVAKYLRIHRAVTRDAPGTLSDFLRIEVMAEQSPNPDSRVELLAERDALGVPRASLRWQLADLDLRSYERAQELFGASLEQAGLGQVFTLLAPDEVPVDLHAASHHMGTTRMHPSPRHGVVNEDSRVHGVANLSVAGSSVFPTGGFANPTLTILALALRLAEHLRD